MSCKLFWRVMRLTYPWLPLAITLWQTTRTTAHHRHRAQVRFWKLYSRIDFAALMEMAIDLIQPEFWV